LKGHWHGTASTNTSYKETGMGQQVGRHEMSIQMIAHCASCRITTVDLFEKGVIGMSVIFPNSSRQKNVHNRPLLGLEDQPPFGF
jgi:hypothetical protein